MKILAKLIFEFLTLIFRSKQGIVLENFALRQQLAVQQRSIKRPKIKNTDRIFWVWLSRIWNDWRSCPLLLLAGAKKASSFTGNGNLEESAGLISIGNL